MTATTEPNDTGPSDASKLAAGVARGGIANLVGAVVYGASGFALLVVLNRGIGIDNAGIVVIAIAIFNILTTVAGVGTSTGLVRTISRLRATDQAELIPMIVRAALVPVTLVSIAATAFLWWFAPVMARIMTDGGRVDEVTSVVRFMAPFVTFATLHSVVVQATRGFDTMLPQVTIEKIGRSLALPVACGAAAYAGFSAQAVGAVWAGTNVVALAVSWRALRVRVDRAVRATGRPAPTTMDPDAFREFWAYTAPRAVGMVSSVIINWFDTIIVGALVSTTAAGIYASGTRYLLPGLFAADALVQVIAPRLSGMLSTGRSTEASALVQVSSGWQVLTMWPIYIVTLLFPTPLLAVFGEEVTEAKGALIALSIAMIMTAPMGPTGAVILMSGRSRQAMFNTLVVLFVNIAGNLIFVPRHGLTAAGIVWGVSIFLTYFISAWQSIRGLRVRTFGAPTYAAMGVTAVTFGSVCVAGRLLLGDAWAGLLTAGIIGTAFYVAGVWRLRSSLHVDSWWQGIRGGARSRSATDTAARGSA